MFFLLVFFFRSLNLRAISECYAGYENKVSATLRHDADTFSQGRNNDKPLPLDKMVSPDCCSWQFDLTSVIGRPEDDPH